VPLLDTPKNAEKKRHIRMRRMRKRETGKLRGRERETHQNEKNEKKRRDVKLREGEKVTFKCRRKSWRRDFQWGRGFRGESRDSYDLVAEIEFR
jgi:hypothetical protein